MTPDPEVENLLFCFSLSIVVGSCKGMMDVLELYFYVPSHAPPRPMGEDG